MTRNKDWLTDLPGAESYTMDARERILEILAHRYVRESQHVMRFRQHANRITDAKTREALLAIAAQEATHVGWLEDKIASLGGALPEVVEIHVSHENARDYLRSDLDEERRCMAEIEDDKESLQSDFPDIVALLDRIEADAEKNSQAIRALLLGDDDSLPIAA